MKRTALALLVVVFAGCGPYIEDDGGPGTGGGPVCYVDADCVPNDCCGEGTRAVHITEARSCRGISCDGTCAPNSIDCGCGIAICRDQRCQVARTVSESCPAF